MKNLLYYCVFITCFSLFAPASEKVQKRFSFNGSFSSLFRKKDRSYYNLDDDNPSYNHNSSEIHSSKFAAKSTKKRKKIQNSVSHEPFREEKKIVFKPKTNERIASDINLTEDQINDIAITKFLPICFAPFVASDICHRTIHEQERLLPHCEPERVLTCFSFDSLCTSMEGPYSRGDSPDPQEPFSKIII